MTGAKPAPLTGLVEEEEEELPFSILEYVGEADEEEEKEGVKGTWQGSTSSLLPDFLSAD